MQHTVQLCAKKHSYEITGRTKTNISTIDRRPGMSDLWLHRFAIITY